MTQLSLISPSETPPENVVYFSPAQGQLVAALEDYLNAAREGTLHSFVGCALFGLDDDVTLMFDGNWRADIYAHIGALQTVTIRLAEIALDTFDSSPSPKKA